MIAPNSLVIVSLLDKLPDTDTILRAEWPQHVTLIPWFKFSDVGLLTNTLGRFASSQQPFSQTVGELELFGPERKIPVNVLEEQDQVKRMHGQLAQLLAAAGVDFEEPEWMLENYRAHITRFETNKDRFYHPGDEITFNNMCLVQLTSPTTTRILKYIPFGDETAA